MISICGFDPNKFGKIFREKPNFLLIKSSEDPQSKRVMVSLYLFYFPKFGGCCGNIWVSCGKIFVPSFWEFEHSEFGHSDIENTEIEKFGSWKFLKT